jgi:hypothetical protein
MLLDRRAPPYAVADTTTSRAKARSIQLTLAIALGILIASVVAVLLHVE